MLWQPTRNCPRRLAPALPIDLLATAEGSNSLAIPFISAGLELLVELIVIDAKAIAEKKVSSVAREAPAHVWASHSCVG